MKNRSTSTFTSTIPALKFADSLIPQTSTIVISATTMNARKLKMIGYSPIIGALVAAAVLIALFVTIERRSDNPMVPMRFFASRNFTGANLVAVATSFLISGLAFALTMYYQNVHGYSAIRTGFTMLPSVVPMMIVGAVSGAVVARFGARHMITVGMVIASGGIFLLSRAEASNDAS